MTLKLTDFELADAEAMRWPKGKTPVFPVTVEEESGTPSGIDFERSPFCVIDETGEDYGLKADSFISASIPDNTRRAYLGDIQYFTKWLEVVSPGGLWPLSEGVILKFIFHHLEEMPLEIENTLIEQGWKRSRGQHAVATVKRRLISLSILHKMNKKKDPCVSQKIKALLSAMEKAKGKQKKSKAITKSVLDNLLKTCCEGSLIDIRDKAILLFGFSSGGRRRSEISDAEFDNLQENVEGDFVYHIEKSKTDQKGKGRDVPIKGIAAIALRAWLLASGITNGKLFRSVSKGSQIGEKITDVDVNRVVKKRCEMAGYDRTQYSAHGLRRGFVTEAGKQGCPLGDTMALTGHRSVPIAMQYYESGAVINNKAANLFG
jgi:integrase